MIQSSLANIEFDRIKAPVPNRLLRRIESFLVGIFEYGDYSFRSAMRDDYGPELICEFFLACRKGRLIGAAGCLYSRRNPDVAIVGPVGVAAKFRGMGVASMLMQNMLDHLRKSSLAAYLGVGNGNPAVGLYRKSGFEKYCGIIMRKLFTSETEFEKTHFANHSGVKIRKAGWGDFCGISVLSVHPCSMYNFDLLNGLFSSRYCPPTRFLSIYPQMVRTVDKHGGCINVLVGGEKENVVGVAQVKKMPSSLQQHIGILDFYLHDNFINNAEPLLKKTVGQSFSLGMKKINCCTPACDIAKKQLLETFGAQKVAIFPSGVIIAGYPDDVLVYEING